MADFVKWLWYGSYSMYSLGYKTSLLRHMSQWSIFICRLVVDWEVKEESLQAPYTNPCWCLCKTVMAELLPTEPSMVSEKKVLTFVNGVHFKSWVEVQYLSTKITSIYTVTNVSTIIIGFLLIMGGQLPKVFIRWKLRQKTELGSLADYSLYSLKIFPGRFFHL